MAHADTVKANQYKSMVRSLDSIAKSLAAIAAREYAMPTIDFFGEAGPTWDEIVEAKSLDHDGVTYTVITQGDEGYVRVEAKKNG